MTGSPCDGADDGGSDRTTDHGLAGQPDAGWLLIAALMSLAGFVVLTVALASRIVLPVERPSLAPARGWDGWPAVWRAMWETANASLVVIGVGIALGLLWMERRPEPVRVPKRLVAVTAAREWVRRLVARPARQALRGLTLTRSKAARAWHGSRALPFALGFVALVGVDLLLVVVARVALDSHYPGDILAGILGGTAALTLYTWSTSPVGRPSQAAAGAAMSEPHEALAPESVTSGG